MTFDMEGRYVPQNFENIFAKYDKGNKGGLTWGDVMDMASGQRMIWDFFGWVATYFECMLHPLFEASSMDTDIHRESNLPPTLA